MMKGQPTTADGRQPIAIGHLSDSGDLKMINTLPEKNIKHHRIKQTLFIKLIYDNTYIDRANFTSKTTVCNSVASCDNVAVSDF